MKTRCSNSKCIYFKRYGGRGITACKDWQTFSGFLKDMYSSYKNHLCIERIDNNKGYSKDNCRWATSKEQANNTHNIEKAKKYVFNGVAHTVRELSEMFGIKRTTLDMRLRQYKWELKVALIK